MKSQALKDQELVKAFIKGDEKAFSTLYDLHNERIKNHLTSILKDRSLAEDFMQDAFVKAVKKIKSGNYNEEGKFLPWIMRIAHNLAIDYFRKKKRQPEEKIDDENNGLQNKISYSENPLDFEFGNKEVRKILKKGIKQLPDSQKKVLIMRHYLKMSFQEISERTGVSINTALGRMRYAVINLKKQLEQSGELALLAY